MGKSSKIKFCIASAHIQQHNLGSSDPQSTQHFWREREREVERERDRVREMKINRKKEIYT